MVSSSQKCSRTRTPNHVPKGMEKAKIEAGLLR